MTRFCRTFIGQWHDQHTFLHKRGIADVARQICSLGTLCTIVSVLKRFRTPAWRRYRAGMFVALGLSAVFPVLHGLRLYGFQQMEQQMGVVWVVLQGALYIVGAGVYAVSVPSHVPMSP